MHGGCRRVKRETFHLIACLKNSLFLSGSKELFIATSVFQLLLFLPSEAFNSKLTLPTLLLYLSCFSLELHHLNRESHSTPHVALAWEIIPACLSVPWNSGSCQCRLPLLGVSSRVVQE